MRTVRLGLVGAGRWGSNYIRTIAGLPDAVIAAIASRNAATADMAPDARIYDSWRALLETDDVEGIIIASPPSSHAEIVIAALNSGRAVMVEKPLVMTRGELDAINYAAGRSNAPIIVDHTHVFHPAFRELKRLCDAYGGAIAIRSSAGSLGPYRPGTPVLWDWAPHDISMALYVDSGPATVRQAVILDERQIDNCVAQRLEIQLQLNGGVLMHTRVSTLDARHRWFAADVANGTLIYRDRGDGPLQWVARPGASGDDQGSVIPVQQALPLTVAVTEFIGSIREQRRERESLRLGCQVVELIADCEQMLSSTAGGLPGT